jgi:predicted sulfurtransferase
MPISSIEVTLYTCERCEHRWCPRDPLAEAPEIPKVCPKCKSPYWNTPRRETKAEIEAKAAAKKKASKKRPK